MQKSPIIDIDTSPSHSGGTWLPTLWSVSCAEDLLSRVKYRGGNLSVATPEQNPSSPGWLRLTSSITVTACISMWPSKEEWHFYLWLSSPKSWSSVMRKTKQTSTDGYAIKYLYASKLFRSSKTKTVWETVRDQERLDVTERWCGSLDGVLQQKRILGAEVDEIWMNCRFKAVSTWFPQLWKGAPHKPDVNPRGKQGWGTWTSLCFPCNFSVYLNQF